VDRILQKQRADQRAAEDAAREKVKQTALVSQANTQTMESTPSVPPAVRMDNRPGSPPPPSVASTGTKSTLSKGFSRVSSMLRPSTASSSPSVSSLSETLPQADSTKATSSDNISSLLPPRPTSARPITPGPHVTPMRDIGTLARFVPCCSHL
jgi:hypothetical protein